MQDYNKPGARIYGSLGGIAVTKFRNDPAPANFYAAVPSVLALDAGDNRIVWRYFDTKALAYGFKAYGGPSLSRFRTPRGIAARSTGEIYVADTGNNRIVKLSYNPSKPDLIEYVMQWGTKGEREGQFNSPSAVALDKDGNVYVADMFNSRIQKFSPVGIPIKSFWAISRLFAPKITNVLGTCGTGKGEFHLPSAVVVSHVDGSIYVADEGVARIQKFGAIGNFIGEIRTLPGMGPNPVYMGMDTDAVGRLYVTDARNNLLYVLDQNLDALLEVYSRDPASPFSSLRGIAVDKSLDLGGNLISRGQIYTTEKLRVSLFSNPLGPAAPASLRVTPMGGASYLEWTLPQNVSGVAGYDVFCRVPGASAFMPIGRTEGLWCTYYLDDTIRETMQVYAYEVRSVDSTGLRGPSSPEASAHAYAETNWRLLQRDVMHQGHAVVSNIWVPKPRVWGTQAGMYVSTAISGGRIFEVAGTTVTARDLKTGGVLWRRGSARNYSSPVVNWVAVQAGRVFFTDGYSLCALDSNTGSVRWCYTIPVPNTLNRYLGRLRPTETAARVGPTVAGDVVYLGAWGTAYAIDAAKGFLRWSRPLAGVQTFEAISPPVVTGNTVVFLSEGGVVQAFPTHGYSMATRQQLPLYVKGLERSVRPVLGVTHGEGKLFIPAYEKLYALDAGTGSVLWSASVPERQFSSEVAVRSGIVYALTEEDAALRCYSAADGALRSVFTVTVAGSGMVSTMSAPALDGSRIFYTVNVRESSRNVGGGRLVAVETDASNLPRSLGMYSVEDIGRTSVTPALSQNTVVCGRTAFARVEATRILLEAPSTVVRNEPFQLTIRMTTSAGTLDTEFAGNVQLVSTDPLASIPPFVSFNIGDHGVMTVPVKLGTFGDITITAKDPRGLLASGQVTVRVRESVGKAELLLVSAPSTALEAIGFTFTVTAIDRFGNVIPSFQGSVAVASSDPLAQLPGLRLFSKADLGRCYLSATLFTIGSQVLSAKETSVPLGAYGEAKILVSPGHDFYDLPGISGYNDIDMFGAQAGFVVGPRFGLPQPTVLSLAGSSWTPLILPDGSGCTQYTGLGVSLSGITSGWMSLQMNCSDGSHGVRYALAGSSWAVTEMLGNDEFPMLRGLTLSTPTDGWECTYKSGAGQIYRFNGTEWQPFQSLPSGAYVSTFRFVRGNPSEGWAIGWDGLMRFRGSMWEAAPSPPTGVLSLWMNSRYSVWAGGFGNTLYYFNGTSWGQVASPAPDPQTAFNAISFYDQAHGIAVGATAGYGASRQPFVASYYYGTWANVPVVPPPQFVSFGLLEARMIGPNEAWAIGAGVNIQTGVLEQPVIVHLRIPPGGPLPMLLQKDNSATLSVDIMPAGWRETETPSLEISDLFVGETLGPLPQVTVGFSVNETCAADVLILSSSMRQICATRMLDCRGSCQWMWDGLEMDGRRARPGWYTAAVSATNRNGAVSRHRLFLRRSSPGGERSIQLPRYLGVTGERSLRHPRGVVAQGEKGLVVVDTGNSRVVRFFEDGSEVQELGRSGVGGGNFSKPEGAAIATDEDGHLLVADRLNNRIQCLTGAGAFMSMFGKKGHGDGEFSEPSAVALATGGRIYVADTRNHRVQVFTRNGKHLFSFGSAGGGFGQFREPSGLAVAKDGTVYVVDRLNDRVQVFEPNGTFRRLLTVRAALKQPTGIAISPAGEIYVSDTGHHEVVVYTPSGEEIGRLGGFGSGEGAFHSPSGLAWDLINLRLYVADTLNNRIAVFGFAELPMMAEGPRPASLRIPQGVATMASGLTAVSGVFSISGLALSPVPFDPKNGQVLTVGFALGVPAIVSGEVRDKHANTVAVLGVQSLRAGANKLTWDGTSAAGHVVPGGTYTVVVTATEGTSSITRTSVFTLTNRGGNVPGTGTGIPPGKTNRGRGGK